MSKRGTTALAALVCALLLIGAAHANDPLSINWWVIGGGGDTVNSASYAVNSTLGQPAVGPATSTSYRLGAGYWYGMVEAVTPPEQKTYLSLVVRGYTAAGFSYEVNGCLEPPERDEGEQVEIRAEGRDIVMEHRNVIYNCCATMVIDLVDQQPLLQLIERETYPDSSPGRCLCPYNLKARITNLPPGTYHVEVWGEGRTRLFGSTWVTIKQKG